jgi:transposase
MTTLANKIKSGHYVGVDVSATSFLAYCRIQGTDKFSNDAEGFVLFQKWIHPSSTVVVESAGPYHFHLTHQLHKWGIRVSAVNALSVRRFCQMKLKHTKTDRKDAQAIYEFASLMKPARWIPPSKHLQKLQQMQSSMDLISKHLNSTKSALLAFNYYPDPNSIARNALEQMMHLQQAQIALLEKKTATLTQRHYQTAYKSLLSIPGVGPKTAVLLILKTDGFRRFKNAKQVVSFAGLAPAVYQSGTSVNARQRITKKGSPDIRKYLYMCALIAIKVNDPCKEMYLRMKEKGKPGRVALIAVCNKLLKQAFAIVKSRSTFNNAFVSILTKKD